MSGEQKLKEGDSITQSVECHQHAVSCCSSPTNARSTRPPPADFDDTKASVLGDYIPAKLGMDERRERLSLWR